jgi:peroxiredoxin
MKAIIAAYILLLLFPHAAFSAQVGSPAPSFSLKDLQGNTVNLSDFEGKVVFLDFWALWCAPCREELPELDSLYKKYRKDGFEVVGICLDTSQQRVTKFLQKVPVTFQILIDKKGDAAEAYRFSGLPAGFLIGRDGAIKHKHMGFGREFLPLFEKEITELLKQENITSRR